MKSYEKRVSDVVLRILDTMKWGRESLLSFREEKHVSEETVNTLKWMNDAQIQTIEQGLTHLATQKSDYLSLDGKLLDRDVKLQGGSEA